MRLVTIDNGNTHQSVGFFDNGVLGSVVPLAEYHPLPDDFILISSVGSRLPVKPSFDLKTRRTKTHFFDMKVNYAETLGDDRLIASYGLFKKTKPNQKILLIDAGTFITCDLVSDQGFMGGYIFPGIKRFLKTYSESAQLPHLTQDLLFQNTNEDLPHTTDEAILKATEMYLKVSLESVLEKTSPDRIVLTGGSATDLKKNISLKVPFELDRHLVHSALSMIHQHHLNQE